MSAIDGLDVVSLLLAAAIGVLLVGRLGSQGVRLTSLTGVLLLAGATLVLGYVFSEVLHALQRGR